MRYLLAAALSLSLTGCVFVNGRPYGLDFDGGTRLQGSGEIVEEVRQPGDFHALELGVPAEVHVKVGHEPRVVLRGDDNLLEKVETSVRNGRLEIEPRRGYRLRFRHGLEIEVHCPELASLEVEGSGEVRVDAVDAEHLQLSIEGSGTVFAAGTASELDVSIEGSGEFLLGELRSREASVSIEGSGEVMLSVSDRLRYSIEGSGDIGYRGSPDVAGTIEGSGNVRRR